MRTINNIDELPDITEMIESDGWVEGSDKVSAIVERIFEDWDCRVPIEDVEQYVRDEISARN